MNAALTTRTVTQENIDLYAEVSGDRNPIHIDPDFARTSQFGGTIAHGQLILGHLAAAVCEELGEDWNINGDLDVKFIQPVFAGSSIEIVLKPVPERPKELLVEVRSGETVAIIGRAWIGQETA